jgi:hypothetical protein
VPRREQDVPGRVPLSLAQGGSDPATSEENTMSTMEDLGIPGNASRGFADVLPETLEEAEELAASIERAVQLETGRGVADLLVEVNSHGILLKGRCSSYYTKQLAQHAAMSIPGGDRLTNSIEVS